MYHLQIKTRVGVRLRLNPLWLVPATIVIDQLTKLKTLDLGYTVVSVVALGVLVHLYRTMEPEERLLRFGLSLVLGGAVGNIIDRVYLHEVVDFFDFGFGSLRWPIFNFADIFVTTGVFLLFWGYSRSEAAGTDRKTADVSTRE